MLRRVWLLLHHLYCAVAMYELTDDGEKALIAGMQRKLRYFFSSRCDLKKRKEKKAKESFPRTPIKEKEKKKKQKKRLSLWHGVKNLKCTKTKQVKDITRVLAELIENE